MCLFQANPLHHTHMTASMSDRNGSLEQLSVYYMDHVKILIQLIHIIIEVSLELNLLGEKVEKKMATAGLKPRVSDCSRHNHNH